MKIGDILKRQFTVSFEFFPPKHDEGVEELFKHIRKLREMNPTFVTVTYGAGGSTREKTRDIVIRMAKEEKLNVMAHLTAIGHSRSEVAAVLDSYRRNGIDDILALRGDTPAGSDLRPEDCEMPHAIDLIRLIREKHGDYFSIGAAAFPERHPESPNMEWEMRFFREKVQAGIEFATTQLFFINRFFYEYMECLEKYDIRIPVLPGIMPITNFKQIKRMADLSRATFPAELTDTLAKYEDSPEDTAKVGIEYAVRQCEDLVKNGVRGLHFYTMNKSYATLEIYEAIRGSLPKAGV